MNGESLSPVIESSSVYPSQLLCHMNDAVQNATTQTPVLAMRSITKSYPGVRAVDDATIDVRPGEVLGLVGENGAGKSTLIKILAGAVAKDGGDIWFDDQLVEINDVRDSKQLGISIIHQELNLVPYFDGAENIFLGDPYPRRWYGGVAWRKLHRQATDILQQLGASIPVDVPVHRLSPGQQTMISIAHGFAANARLMVMDEPTAALTDQEIEYLYAVINALRSRGVSVIYVSHRLEEIFELTDRVTIMRNGRVVATEQTAELDQAKLVRLMIGRDVETVFPPRSAGREEALLEIEGLTGAIAHNISFTLHGGEVLGIAGLVGAGRSELLRMIFGVTPKRSGSVRLNDDGAANGPRSPADAFRHGVALVPEERRSQGLILGRPIYENVTLTHLAQFARAGLFLDRRRELAVTKRLGDTLGLKAADLRQPVMQLSGGNQQKVVFARCLAGEARVLMLDEPTRGIDVGAKLELYQIIRDLADDGAGVLLVSSELPELIGLADRILVLHEGRQMGIMDAAGASQEEILRQCYGFEATETTERG